MPLLSHSLAVEAGTSGSRTAAPPMISALMGFGFPAGIVNPWRPCSDDGAAGSRITFSPPLAGYREGPERKVLEPRIVERRFLVQVRDGVTPSQKPPQVGSHIRGLTVGSMHLVKQGARGIHHQGPSSSTGIREDAGPPGL